ncbi:MAG TPA: HD domain-containing protein [Methylomirabilota bacterium]|nr:HD domain-containing protein [Methylomirabilota bacterium]
MAELRLDRLPPASAALLRLVAREAAEAVLVGGAVRDAVLKRATVDVDVAVPSGALDLARRCAERLGGTCVVLDAERGAARVVTEGGPTLDLTDFRAPTLAGDLAARDFSVNALAVPLVPLVAHGRAAIVDPTGGLTDLRTRRLRPAGPGVLDDDPLRALRAVRLEASLGLRLTPSAARAVRAAARGLARVAPERIRDELLILLTLPETARALRRADALGVLGVVMPEVEPMRATAQPAPHRFDVLEHSLRAVAGVDRLLARLDALAPYGEELAVHVAEPLGGGVRRATTLKLAALLHDVSKPETRRRVGGRVRFFEHDVIGARRTRDVGERLRLPERATAVIERLVRHHLRPMHLGHAAAITLRARYRFYRDLREDTRDLLLLVLADAAAVTGASPLATWRHAGVVRDLFAGWSGQQDAEARPALVRGEDVMARFALPPGPRVGWLLAQAREAQDLGRVKSREEALAFLDSLDPGP